MDFKSLKNIILILISLGAAVFLFQISLDIYRFLDFPYQNEYRQVAFMPLVNGLIPISEWYSDAQTPNNLYVYGFFYPFLIKLIPISNKLLASKIISVSSFILTSILLSVVYYRTVKISDRNISLLVIPILLSLFFIVGRNAIISSTPTALGQLLFLTSIFSPFIIKNKKGLFIAAICGILAFFSKPYYALALPFLAIALFLFSSKKRALQLFNIATPIFLLSVLLIHYYWPGYFSRTFFTHLGYPIPGSSKHLQFQLNYLIDNEYLIFIALTVSSLFLLWKYKLIMDLRNFKQPLLLNDNPFFYSILIIALLGTFMFFISMGKHVGSSNGHYFYHLVYPFLLLIVFLAIDREKKLDYVVILILGVHLFYSAFNYQSYRYLRTTASENQKVELFLSQFKEILNTGNVAGILYSQNKTVYDNGNMEYFYDGMNHLFGDFEEYVSIHSTFQNGIMSKISNSEFELLMNNPNIGPYILPGESKGKNYVYIGSIHIKNPRGKTMERLFIRKDLVGKVKLPKGLELLQEFKN